MGVENFTFCLFNNSIGFESLSLYYFVIHSALCPPLLHPSSRSVFVCLPVCFLKLYSRKSKEPAATETTTTDTGAPIGESLWKLPNRRFHPEYYEQIKKPISMTQIRNKLKKGVYTNITEMTADLYQMIDNAKKAYASTHKVHKDAAKMQKVLSQKLLDVGNEQEDTDDDSASVLSDVPVTPMPKKKGRPRVNAAPAAAASTPGTAAKASGGGRVGIVGGVNPGIKKKMLNLAKYLNEARFEDRDMMLPFREKPCIKLYPMYYEVIEHPIDMQTIEANVREDRYGSLDEMVGDFRLMFENCREFNEDESLIVEDANRLEGLLDDKLKEISAASVGKTPVKM